MEQCRYAVRARTVTKSTAWPQAGVKYNYIVIEGIKYKWRYQKVGGNGGACVSKSLCFPTAHHTHAPTRGLLVEAECGVDDRVFSGISETRKKKYGR